MYDYLIFLAMCFYLILPAFIANGIPALIKYRIKFWAQPIDFNLKFRNKPLFGKNKTWRGLIIGTLCGVLVFIFQKYLYQFSYFENLSLINYFEFSIVYGILLSFGALFGDLMGSFLKRQVNISPGKNFYFLDQVDSTIGAIVFSSLIFVPCVLAILTIIILGIVFHAGGNLVLDFLRSKKMFT